MKKKLCHNWQEKSEPIAIENSENLRNTRAQIFAKCWHTQRGKISKIFWANIFAHTTLSNSQASRYIFTFIWQSTFKRLYKYVPFMQRALVSSCNSAICGLNTLVSILLWSDVPPPSICRENPNNPKKIVWIHTRYHCVQIPTPGCLDTKAWNHFSVKDLSPYKE